MPVPVVLDLSHWNETVDLAACKRAGLVGVILKASQGTGYVDDRYAARRDEARAAGLLVGSYHFGTNADPQRQVDHYLRTAKPADDELVCLDFEDNGAGKTMSLDQARVFMRLVQERTGRSPVIYSGHNLREGLSAGKVDAEFAQYRLWHAQYGPRPVTHPTWGNPWLWQYSDRGQFPGVVGNVDVNAYTGNGDIREEWAGSASPAATTAPPRAEPLPPVPVERPTPQPSPEPNAGRDVNAGVLALVVGLGAAAAWLWKRSKPIAIGLILVAAVALGWWALKG